MENQREDQVIGTSENAMEGQECVRDWILSIVREILSSYKSGEDGGHF